jgi:hypothetical protein
VSDDKKVLVSRYNRSSYKQQVHEDNTEPSSAHVSRPQPNTASKIFRRDKLGRFLENEVPAYTHEYGKDVHLPSPKKPLVDKPETQALKKALGGKK